MNLLVRYITQGRVEGDRPPMTPRRLTRLMLTHPDHLTDAQRERHDELTAACPEMIDLVGFRSVLPEEASTGLAPQSAAKDRHSQHA